MRYGLCSLSKAVWWSIVVNVCVILVSCGQLSHWQSYHIFFFIYLLYGKIVRVYACLAWFIWPWPHFHGSLVKVKFLSFVFFLILYALGQLYLLYGNILWSICQSHRFYLTLTSFYGSLLSVKFLCFGLFFLSYKQ